MLSCNILQSQGEAGDEMVSFALEGGTLSLAPPKGWESSDGSSWETVITSVTETLEFLT